MERAHHYLGVMDLQDGSHSILETGSRHWLPILPLNSIILLPGAKIPLLLTQDEEVKALRHALCAKPPVERLIAVVWWSAYSQRLGADNMIGCTAAIKQTAKGESSSATWRAVAVGVQRVQVFLTRRDSEGCVCVEALPEGSIIPVPKFVREYYASIVPQTSAPWDLDKLAATARSLCAGALPGASQFTGPPHLLSWWLAANLPIQGAVRQHLLECKDTCERLHCILGILRSKLKWLTCALCGLKIALASEAVAMTDEGLAGAFVNAHGYLHDMVTVRCVEPNRLVYQGGCETAHSWFPGYAWRICNCRMCQNHLGWQFTLVRSPAEKDKQVPGDLTGNSVRCDTLQTSQLESRPLPALGWLVQSARNAVGAVMPRRSVPSSRADTEEYAREGDQRPNLHQNASEQGVGASGEPFAWANSGGGYSGSRNTLQAGLQSEQAAEGGEVGSSQHFTPQQVSTREVSAETLQGAGEERAPGTQASQTQGRGCQQGHGLEVKQVSERERSGQIECFWGLRREALICGEVESRNASAAGESDEEGSLSDDASEDRSSSDQEEGTHELLANH